MRELHATIKNVNMCRVWMGRQQDGGGAGYKTALTGTNFRYHLLGDLMVDDDWTETGDSRTDIRPSRTFSYFRKHM